MTAEKILVKNNVFQTEDVNQHFNLDVTRDCYVKTQKDIVKSMKEYAELKCKELLEIVTEKVEATVRYVNGEAMGVKIDKNSVLNAVDLKEFIQ